MTENFWIFLIILSPFVGFLINGLFHRKIKLTSGIIATFAVGISFISSLITFANVQTHETITFKLYQWIPIGSTNVELGFLIDPLTAVMLLVVTGVGLFIHIYSIGYMHGDRSFSRFFTYLNLFIFAMLILLMADNYLMMFVGWEGVGLCSYLLIGFWYEKKSATDAGKKAFIVNRIGDFGFLIGIFTLLSAFGTLDFHSIFDKLEDQSYVPIFGANTLKIATLLLLVGAIGKSAQIPLYVWLPDAMEGPTPVSALIHAATMVTAGVYMVARSSLLFELAGTGIVVAWIGVLTAFFAATMAVTACDIKRVLAYSTISQLGYMFVAIGLGAYQSGIFHLVTHACFKGLMFLAAGSVMHAMANEVDMRKMGGLASKLPITYGTFLIGALAISGFPLLSGFWSKEAILHAAWETNPKIYFIALLTAFMTAFYMFRLMVVTFHGESRIDPKVAEHLHESPPVISIPLVVLAIPSALIGFVGVGGHHSPFHKFLKLLEHSHSEGSEAGFMFVVVSIAVSLIGMTLAWLAYRSNPPGDEAASSLGKLVAKNYYIDELYSATIVKPILSGSRKFLWKVFDVLMIDGLVNSTAFMVRGLGGLLRQFQTGITQSYALSMLFGIVLFLAYYLWL